MVYFLILIIIPFIMIWHGFVLSKIWIWFLVPAFNFSILDIPTAIGIMIIIRFITHSNNSTTYKDDDIEMLLQYLCRGFLIPGWVLLVSWIVTFFM